MKTSTLQKRMRVAVLGLFLSFVSTSMFAQAWVDIGSRRANFGIDHDVIDVTYRDGYFTAIKLEVTDGAMNMMKCVVHFENGSMQEVELRHNFGPNSSSRVIDLNGGKRYIKKIDFWYDTKGFSDSKAKITVFGRK